MPQADVSRTFFCATKLERLPISLRPATVLMYQPLAANQLERPVALPGVQHWTQRSSHSQLASLGGRAAVCSLPHEAPPVNGNARHFRYGERGARTNHSRRPMPILRFCIWIERYHWILVAAAPPSRNARQLPIVGSEMTAQLPLCGIPTPWLLLHTLII